MYYRGLPSLHLHRVSRYVPTFPKLFFSRCFSVRLHSSTHWNRKHFFLGQWHEENMVINYVEEHPKAILRADHAASIRLQLEKHWALLMDFSLWLCIWMRLYREFPSAMFLVNQHLMMCASVCMSFDHIHRQDSSHQTTSISTLSSCHDTSATIATVTARFNTQNW